jgi:hypothetical protein
MKSDIPQKQWILTILRKTLNGKKKKRATGTRNSGPEMLNEGESNSGNLKWRHIKMKYCKTFLTEAVGKSVNAIPCISRVEAG